MHKSGKQLAIGGHARLLGAGLVTLAVGALWLVYPAARLDVPQAREALQRLAGAAFKKELVEIKSIAPGTGANHAIVEARLQTAFRLEQQGGVWRVAEVRWGDRQWESLELLEEAVRREKARRTTALLQRLAAGLAAYQREHKQYVAADNAAVLLDYLAPRYLSPPLRFDLWGGEFLYRGTAASYRLSSAGADRRPETNDDIVIENGALRAGAE